MKGFAWRIIICLVPLLIGTLVVANSFRKYYAGKGGFKLGVDLVGGTILIYEVDLDKFEDKQLPEGWDPQELATRLKSRIDPNDLYNITVRVASETRFEIILPTGGALQVEAEQAAWNGILQEMKDAYPKNEYKVAPGRVTELVAAVYAQHPDQDVETIRAFIEENYKEPEKAEDKEKAWKELLDKLAQDDRFKPEGYAVSRGQINALAAAILEQQPDADLGQVMEQLKNYQRQAGQGQAMTTEEVEQRKELISQQGSMEFRILANDGNDQDALNAAKAYFEKARTDEATLADLQRRALLGLPPPPPTNPNGDPFFDTANGRASYAWIEVGPVFRYDHGLANPRNEDGELIAEPEKASEEEIAAFLRREPYRYWRLAHEAREGNGLFTLPDFQGGLLIYSRKIPGTRPLAEKDREKLYEHFILTRDPNPRITGDDVAGVRPREDLRGVNFSIKPARADAFYELTSSNINQPLSIVLDGMVESAANIQSGIRDSGQITGQFTRDKIDQLVRVIRSGRLPATLKSEPVSENTMGPTLGADTIRSGGRSIVIAFVLILLFMVAYYHFAGVVACIALLANLILTIAFMVLIDATFTLPGLAGLVLTMGMVVDSNILIYERIREERERGSALPLAIRTGYDRAFSTIIDTHLTSILTAIILYIVGNDQLRGFGVSLTVGLTISLFTTLYLTRVIFDLGVARNWVTSLSMFKLLSRPRINFMKYRYQFFTVTVVLTVLGGALFVWRLDRGGLNIDFTAGTAYTAELTKPLSAGELRKELAPAQAELGEVSIEQIFLAAEGYTEGTKSKIFTVRTGEQDVKKVEQEIYKALGPLLKTIQLADFEIIGNNKEVLLSFIESKNPNAENPGAATRPAFASKAQVTRLLTTNLRDQQLDQAANQLTVEGLGPDKDGRYAWMKVIFAEGVTDRARLETALRNTQEDMQRPQPERLENFDPQLAAKTQTQALYAIIASWCAILLYLWFRFGNWTFGLAAVFCLIHDLTFTLGIIAACHYVHDTMIGRALLLHDFKIDLPTIASLLTLVGYSVNDTIVVFDRIREVRGKNPALTAQMINDSINQTLSRTLLASFTTWLVVIVLYIFGGEGVHLFSFVMVVGVVIGTYSSIYVASSLLLMFKEGGAATEEATRKEELAAAAATQG